MSTTTHEDAMKAHLKTARDIAAKAEADGNRDFTDDEHAEVTTALKSYADAKKAFEKANSTESVKSQLQAIGLELGLDPTGDEPGGTPSLFHPGAKSRAKSVGETFIESPEYKAFIGGFADGRIPEKARVQSQPVGYKALLTGLSDTSGGAFVNTDVTGIVELLGRRPLSLRDIISVRQTGSDTVEFVRQTARTNAAAPVPEATTSAGPTSVDAGGALVPNAGGGYKPEGGFTFVKVTATVKTIAEWVAATKRGLADAGQLRGLIDQELRDDLAEEEEDQVVNGSGTGENLEGILATSGIQAQPWSATVDGLDPVIETTLKAKTKVRTVGRSIPTAYLFNPADWERIELARLAKNPANEGTGQAIPTHHGLPVVQSEAIAAGVGLVADFRKAVLWDREQAAVSVTDSHADFFIRNLVAVLAEERVAFGVTRPSAFVTIDLTA